MPVLQLLVARMQEVLIQKLCLWMVRPGQQDIFRRGHHQNPIVGAVFRGLRPTHQAFPAQLLLDAGQEGKGAPPERHYCRINAGIMAVASSLDDPLVVPCAPRGVGCFA